MITTRVEMADYAIDCAQSSMADSEDGHLHPNITAVDGNGDMMNFLLPSEQHPSDYIKYVTAILCTRETLRYIAFSSEAWSKQFSADEDRPNLKRGELAEMHEAGDDTVRTIIIVGIFDIASEEVATYMVQQESPEGMRPVRWGERRDGNTATRETAWGNVEVGFFEGLDSARAIMKNSPPPPPGGFAAYLTVLTKVGLTAGGWCALVKEEDDDA